MRSLNRCLRSFQQRPSAQCAENDLASHTDAWKAHATVLKELLEHHIDEEESEIFSALEEQFSDEQRDAMGSAFLQQKERLLEKKPASE